MLAPIHTPVLLEETMQALAVQPGGRYVDCTVGTGGHSATTLETSAPGGQLLGSEADPQALEIARTRLEQYSSSFVLVNDNFVNLESICRKYNFLPVHGILFDLGLSSLQLEAGRGFSFQHDAPLDMRFSPGQETTAADIVNTYSEAELAEIIWAYGEERASRQIARRIVKERPVETTTQLARVVEQAVGGRHGKIHPATKTFQALRIAVNQELQHLESALKQAVNLLGYEGRLVVISYHSLEDRIVKHLMQQEAKGCICPPHVPVCTCGHQPRLRMLNKNVIVPSEEEIRRNPRSRSARLRAAERVVNDNEYYDITASGGSTGWRQGVLPQERNQ